MVNKTSPGGRGGCKKNLKKGINIFSNKGFLRWGHNVAKGRGPKKKFLRALMPPPKQKPSYAPEIRQQLTCLKPSSLTILEINSIPILVEIKLNIK